MPRTHLPSDQESPRKWPSLHIQTLHVDLFLSRIPPGRVGSQHLRGKWVIRWLTGHVGDVDWDTHWHESLFYFPQFHHLLRSPQSAQNRKPFGGEGRNKRACFLEDDSQPACPQSPLPAHPSRRICRIPGCPWCCSGAGLARRAPATIPRGDPPPLPPHPGSWQNSAGLPGLYGPYSLW